MRGRALRLLLSTHPSHVSALRNRSTPPLLARILPCFLASNCYSSFPRKPGRDRQKMDERSEDYFLRNLNFGGDGGHGGRDGSDEELNPTHHQGFPGKRPMRGERRIDAEEKAFPRQHNEMERRGSGNLRQRFDHGREDSIGGEESYNAFEDFPDRSSELDERPELSRRESSQDVNQSSFVRNLKFNEAVGVREAKEEAVEKPKETEEEGRNARISDESVLSETSPQDADEIFKKMKETGLVPNAVAMLDGLCKDGLVQEAMKLFGLMREKGTIPELVIYTAVVEGFCKAAKYEDAKRIFRKMQSNGIVPNAFSYQIIVQGLYKGKRLEDSVEFCMEMVEVGHSPNPATFTGLVNAICKEKGVEGAEKAIKRLRESGLLVDEKAVREHLDKKGPFSPLVQKAIFGSKGGGIRTF